MEPNPDITYENPLIMSWCKLPLLLTPLPGESLSHKYNPNKIKKELDMILIHKERLIKWIIEITNPMAELPITDNKKFRCGIILVWIKIISRDI